MANWSDPRATARPDIRPAADARDVSFDAGLRAHMLSVYNYMASGVLLTGIVAYGAALMGIPQALFMSGASFLGIALMLAPLVMAFYLMARFHRMSTAGMQVFFWSFAVLMGLSMSYIPILYNGSSIATAFAGTAAAFASLSLWGYTTKKDLSGFGTFLIMGVVGLLVASIANVIVRSDAMSLAISAVGVLLFAGLTAYDTQKIKSLYFELAGTEFLGKSAIMGALTLYLDFINMFRFLLSLIGSRE